MSYPPTPSPVTAQALRFARYLRRQGLPVSPAQTLDFVHSLAWIDLTERRAVRDAARTIFVRRQEQIPLFEAAFDHFWSNTALDPRARRSLLEEPRLEPVWAIDAIEAVDLTDQPDLTPDRVRTYSAVEYLRQRDFGSLTPAEAAAVQSAIVTIAQRLPVRRSRRLQPTRRGRQVDWRSTLRASVRTSGDPLHLARRSRQVKPRPIVLLCDVSGSMERYARILLQFAYALANPGSGSLRKVEAFVFSTRLTRVTPYLRHHPFRRSGKPVLDTAISAAQDWGGGTRIGECLRSFHAQWAPRVLNRSAIVLLISDGCDRGDIPLLSNQLARLHRRSHRLIWLNPWLGQAGYQPAVRGMQAALPHIDRLLPIHNLVGLEQLVAIITRLDA
jgi:uncharacterized protein